MTVKLSSKLPDIGPSNGIELVTLDAIRDPDKYTVYVVARLCVKELTRDIDNGRIIPTFRVLRLEPMTADDNGDQAAALLDAAYRARTGDDELPFEEDDRAEA